MEQYTTLLFIKNEGDPRNWEVHDGNGAQYFTGFGWLTWANGYFRVNEPNGEGHAAGLWSDCLVRDDSSGTTGTPYAPTSPQDLVNKLGELNCPLIRANSVNTLEELLANSPQSGGAVFASIPIAIGIPSGPYSIIGPTLVSTTDTASKTVSLNGDDGTLDVQTGGGVTKISGVDVVGGEQTLKIPNNSGVTETIQSS